MLLTQVMDVDVELCTLPENGSLVTLPSLYNCISIMYLGKGLCCN